MSLFNRKRRDEPEPVDLDQRSPQLGVKLKDLLVLQQMQEQGAKLTEPRHVLHYLYFPSQEQAQAAAEVAQQQGWGAQVRDPLSEQPDEWGVVCEQQAAVLTPEFVRDSTDFFEDLAATHAGQYDGWEAGIGSAQG